MLNTRSHRQLSFGRLLATLLGIAVALLAPNAFAGGRAALVGVVNLNTATAEELQLLPGVGPSKAQLILEHRKARPFRTVEELVRVRGIGRKTLQKLKPHLTVNGETTVERAAAAPGRRAEGGETACVCPPAAPGPASPSSR